MVLLNGPASPVLMTIDLLHLPGAHRNGEVIVHVDSADVIQAGDVTMGPVQKSQSTSACVSAWSTPSDRMEHSNLAGSESSQSHHFSEGGARTTARRA
ncbi:hypothetical protein [Synechococcus sp. RedBA-s]|uniref:hypothetical protein n=1 Tax=Synechococcus sp. RedBA-s TaxID=2823741 RepID=UPI0020CE7164|nr:hypothetical protein [Synechococcus sp. RedBA-s]MCP9800599.1 hypothetical protein [Synechococcus sp. RedBA-s]